MIGSGNRVDELESRRSRDPLSPLSASYFYSSSPSISHSEPTSYDLDDRSDIQRNDIDTIVLGHTLAMVLFHRATVNGWVYTDYVHIDYCIYVESRINQILDAKKGFCEMG